MGKREEMSKNKTTNARGHTLPVLRRMVESSLMTKDSKRALPLLKKLVPLYRLAYGVENCEFETIVIDLLERFIDVARSKLENRKHDECKTILSVVYDLLPRSDSYDDVWALLHNVKACYYRSRGRLQLALRELRHAAKYVHGGPSLATLSINMCAILSQLGKHRRALQHAQTAVVVLQNEKQDLSAPSSSLTSCSVRENLSLAYYNCGVELEFCNQTEQAMKMYNHAISCIESLSDVSLGPVLAPESGDSKREDRSVQSDVRSGKSTKRLLRQLRRSKIRLQIRIASKQDEDKKKDRLLCKVVQSEENQMSQGSSAQGEKSEFQHRKGKRKIRVTFGNHHHHQQDASVSNARKNRENRICRSSKAVEKKIHMTNRPGRRIHGRPGTMRKMTVGKRRRPGDGQAEKIEVQSQAITHTGERRRKGKHREPMNQLKKSKTTNAVSVTNRKKNVARNISGITSKKRVMPSAGMRKTERLMSSTKTLDVIRWLKDAGIQDDVVYSKVRKRRVTEYTLRRLQRMYFTKTENERASVDGRVPGQRGDALSSSSAPPRNSKSWIALHDVLQRDFGVSRLGDRLRFEVALSRLENPQKRKSKFREDRKQMSMKSSARPREINRESDSLTDTSNEKKDRDLSRQFRHINKDRVVGTVDKSETTDHSDVVKNRSTSSMSALPPTSKRVKARPRSSSSAMTVKIRREVRKIARAAAAHARKSEERARRAWKQAKKRSQKQRREAMRAAIDASEHASKQAGDIERSMDELMKILLKNTTRMACDAARGATSGLKELVSQAFDDVERARQIIDAGDRRERRRQRVRMLIEQEVNRLDRERASVRRSEETARRRDEEESARQQREEAASRLQFATREHLRRVMQVKNAAASVLQWFVRGRMSERMKQKKEEADAAEREMRRALVVQARHAAATVIQCAYRQDAARRVVIQRRHDACEIRRVQREKRRLESQGVDKLRKQYVEMTAGDPLKLPQQSLSVLREAERSDQRRRLLEHETDASRHGENQTDRNCSSGFDSYIARQDTEDAVFMEKVVSDAVAKESALVAHTAASFAMRLARDLDEKDVIGHARRVRHQRERELMKKLREMQDAKRREYDRLLYDKSYIESRRQMDLERMRVEDEFAHSVRERLRARANIDMERAEAKIAHLGATLRIICEHSSEARQAVKAQDAYAARKKVEKMESSLDLDNDANTDAGDSKMFFLAPGERGTYEKCRVIDDLSSLDDETSLVPSVRVVFCSDRSVLSRVSTKDLRSFHPDLEGRPVQGVLSTKSLVIERNALSREKKEIDAATRIQAFCRGRRMRNALRAQSQGRNHAAIVIQTMYRGRASRQTTQRVRARIARAAVTIQRQIKVVSLRRAIRQRRAAKRIQAIQRGGAVRTRYAAILSKRSPKRIRCRAVSLVQSIYRGYMLRKRLIARHLAASKIQSSIRGILARRRMVRRRAAGIVQTRWRLYLRRRDRHIRELKSRQKATECARQREKDAIKCRAAVIVQSRWRQYLQYQNRRDVVDGSANPKLQRPREMGVSVAHVARIASVVAKASADAASSAIEDLKKMPLTPLATTASPTKLDLRRRRTKKRLLVTLFAEALEVHAEKMSPRRKNERGSEEWGSIKGAQLKRIVTAPFVAMFFPTHSKIIASMTSTLASKKMDAPIACNEFVQLGMEALSNGL